MMTSMYKMQFSHTIKLLCFINFGNYFVINAVAVAITATKNEKIKGVIVAVLDDSRAGHGGGQARPSPSGNRPRKALYHYDTFENCIQYKIRGSSEPLGTQGLFKKSCLLFVTVWSTSSRPVPFLAHPTNVSRFVPGGIIIVVDCLFIIYTYCTNMCVCAVRYLPRAAAAVGATHVAES